MENLIEKQGAEVINSLIEKAWGNSEFKEQLINNPSKTISKFIGKELGSKMPDGKQIVVVDQTNESNFYLNIPSKPNLDLELSLNQLEQVAGGATGPFYDWGKAFGDWLQGK